MVTSERGGRLILLDGETYSASGAQSAKSVFKPWIMNPRFALKTANYTGAGSITLDIESSLINGVWHLLYSFTITADGNQVAWNNDLNTSFPFRQFRANLSAFTATSADLTLWGEFDPC